MSGPAPGAGPHAGPVPGPARSLMHSWFPAECSGGGYRGDLSEGKKQESHRTARSQQVGAGAEDTAGRRIVSQEGPKVGRVCD